MFRSHDLPVVIVTLYYTADIQYFHYSTNRELRDIRLFGIALASASSGLFFCVKKCKMFKFSPEPGFGNLLRSPGIDSYPGGIDSWIP